MREYKSGATRDDAEHKIDPEGYLSPLVIKAFSEYMLRHQKTAKGMRGSDNWQGLFGEEHYDVCAKSMWRHFLDFWMFHRGYKGRDDMEEALCAILFNSMAYLHKYLVEKERGELSEETKKKFKSNLEQKN